MGESDVCKMDEVHVVGWDLGKKVGCIGERESGERKVNGVVRKKDKD